jgi:hypothetical protein
LSAAETVIVVRINVPKAGNFIMVIDAEDMTDGDFWMGL